MYEPKSHLIEPSKTGRSKCRSCGEVIEKGTLRLAELFVSEHSKDVAYRFHHLPCAADKQPYILELALKTATIEVPEKAELKERIERALKVADVAAQKESLGVEYQRFVEAMNEAEDPRDDTIIVFADWLQSADDPRGELIVVQTELETAKREARETLRERESKLLAAHRRQLVPNLLDSRITWKRGFIHRLEIVDHNGLVKETLAHAFEHPSLLLLRELAVALANDWNNTTVAPNLPSLPHSLRTLELGKVRELKLGQVSELIRPLPRLERLSLFGAADVEALEHPKLIELELITSDPTESLPHQPLAEARSLIERVAPIRSRQLPALRSLVLRADRGLDELCRALAETNLGEQLDKLALQGDLTATGAEHLHQLLRGKRLASIQLLGPARPSMIARLRPLAEEIATETVEQERRPVTTSGEDWVRHTKRPEWGRGRIVQEHDDRLEVEFEHAGHKVIRGVELLERISEGTSP